MLQAGTLSMRYTRSGWRSLPDPTLSPKSMRSDHAARVAFPFWGPRASSGGTGIFWMALASTEKG